MVTAVAIGLAWVLVSLLAGIVGGKIMDKMGK